MRPAQEHKVQGKHCEPAPKPATNIEEMQTEDTAKDTQPESFLFAFMTGYDYILRHKSFPFVDLKSILWYNVVIGNDNHFMI